VLVGALVGALVGGLVVALGGVPRTGWAHVEPLQLLQLQLCYCLLQQIHLMQLAQQTQQFS
jgi:hypothetical protein